MKRKISNICGICAGYVVSIAIQGGPTCAVLANKITHVTVVDLDQGRIDAWISTQLPIYEPNLPDVVELPRDGDDARKPNLFFSTDLDSAIETADLIFRAVNTPTKTIGHGAGRASDLTYVESAARRIAESTVPCGTANVLRDVFDSLARPFIRFEVLSKPKFLAEGTAIIDLLYPDRILIGSLNSQEALEASNALAAVYGGWVPHCKIKTFSLWSCELAKLAANCMLAQRISSISSLSTLCESMGTNIYELATTAGLDSRIGPKILKDSAGFGEYCFRKDVPNLFYIAESHNLTEVAAYWRRVVDINKYQKNRFAKRIVNALNNTLANKEVAVLGFAYKKDDGDTRESAAISVVGQFIAERAHVAIYDPKVEKEQILRDLESDHLQRVVARYVTICDNAYAACDKAAAVTLSRGIPWRLDWALVAGTMRRLQLVFDGRNIVEPAKLIRLGFRVHCVGKGVDL
ncbi:MAG: hypothetical protein FE78DRAFT_108445 [Acidomyces sp. 'richmondensis']|nr:MAG: hypothetical protein FE78DRAFT_108445 [Acidomyces sp. 'richmondensis']